MGLAGSLEQLSGAGSSLEQLSGAGSSLEQLSGAGSSLEQLNGAGSSLEQLSGAGSSLEQLSGAGSSLEQLSGALAENSRAQWNRPWCMLRRFSHPVFVVSRFLHSRHHCCRVFQTSVTMAAPVCSSASCMTQSLYDALHLSHRRVAQPKS